MDKCSVFENLEWCTLRHNTNHYYNSKYPGVTKINNKRYRARIELNKKRLHLGYFETPEEAALAYANALSLS